MWLKQQLRVRITDPQAGGRGYSEPLKPQSPQPQWHTSSNKAYLLILPKQFQQLETKHSNIWSYRGHSLEGKKTNTGWIDVLFIISLVGWLVVVFNRHVLKPWLVWNSLYRPCWPWATSYRLLPLSLSQVLKLIWVTMPTCDLNLTRTLGPVQLQEPTNWLWWFKWKMFPIGSRIWILGS